MAKTIIQTIGPLYGEVVNGTVFGRPNGSVFVPSENTIELSLVSAFRFARNTNSTTVCICNSAGSIPWVNAGNMAHAVAQSQDIANYIEFDLAEDSEFNTIIGTMAETAGNFNLSEIYLIRYSEYTIVAETTYYLRARLMSASGVAVATSDTIEIEGVVV